MMLESMVSLLMEGMITSIEIFLLTLLFSLPLGLLISFGRMSGFAPLRWLMKVYISIMRGTPLMLQLIVVFFGPYYIFGATLSPDYRFIAVIIAFSLNYAAYFAEIYRGGIEAIPKGQYEAAKILGYNKYTTFMKIILPQSFKRIIPPLANEFIVLIKDSSLVSTIGVYDLMQTSNILGGKYYNYFVPMIGAALVYLVLTLVISHFTMKLEKRLAESD